MDRRIFFQVIREVRKCILGQSGCDDADDKESGCMRFKGWLGLDVLCADKA